jgi:hypothetical protein
MRYGAWTTLVVLVISSSGGAYAAQTSLKPNAGDAPVVKFQALGEPRGLPHWIHRPTGDDVVQVFPARALEAGKEAHTSMSCKVTAEGTLTQCVITEETPPGWGFGQASLALAPKFLMSPKTDADVSVEGGTVVIPINWKLR